MEISNRIAIISENNILEISKLYGKLNIDRLSEIINNHVKVAIDEIKEDLGYERIKH